MVEQLPSLCKAGFETEVTHFLMCSKMILLDTAEATESESKLAVLFLCV